MFTARDSKRERSLTQIQNYRIKKGECKMYNTGVIYFSEKNVHGAWVVYGLAGIKQYYGYTKREAERRYRDEYKKTFIVNKK